MCAVAVTYHPERDALLALIGQIRPQVASLVVIDNGSSASPVAEFAGIDAVVLPQRTNIGLAAAQNIGIEWARVNGHSHVLLLDQDSTPEHGMVKQLLESLDSTSAGQKVAAVGPRFHDPRERRDAPFVKVAFPVSQKISCGNGDEPVQCDFLIGSGALIPIAVLDEVGDMDAGLFIDSVDLEWSFRARARGYALFGVCSATMIHYLGDDRRQILFGTRQVVTHGPVRLYYIMRNRVLLYRLKHTPRAWIAQDVIRIPFKFAIFAVLVGPRATNARMMVHGLVDGLRGRRGRCPYLVVDHD